MLAGNIQKRDELLAAQNNPANPTENDASSTVASTGQDDNWTGEEVQALNTSEEMQTVLPKVQAMLENWLTSP